MESFVGKWEDFEDYTFLNRKPMKFSNYRSNVIILGSLGQKASSSVKYALEFLYAVLGQTI